MPQLPSVGDLFATIIGGVPEEQRPLLVALAEKIAAGRYRDWAEQAPAPARDELSVCANREEEIARRVEALYPDAVAVQASYQFHPLWGVDLLTITSLVDRSALLSGGVSWSVGPNSSLRGGFFLGIGDGAGDLTTGFETEFGAQPNVGYLSLSHFF